MNNSTLQAVLNGLMSRYMDRVPDVKAVIDAMISVDVISSAAEIENDHIAFRTMGVPNLGMASFEKIFLHYGYARRDRYHFSQKKLDAYWYAPPSPEFPRIFVSELRVSDLPVEAQEIIRSYTDSVQSDPVDILDLDDPKIVDSFLHSGLWRRPTFGDYKALADISEYAAWVIYNRYYLNHFTISVHNLKDGYNSIEHFNQFLERHDFKLNDSGGKIKKSDDGLLLQSSTVARKVEAEFADGTKTLIPGSYVEFAERKVLPGYTGKEGIVPREYRREGFEAANADKIFESTYKSQTER
ncbi:MAG TPA: DUF1338 domain-containing protein [Flavitalea sp.]|nr:DUF1338 domain-containing protein [Flavitalea sp.]